MTNFLDFLRHRLVQGGFTTEDALASVLPLVRQTAAAHQAGKVAPLSDVNELHVEGVKIWYEEARTQDVADQSRRVEELDQPPRRALEIVGEKRWTAEVDHDASSVEDLHIGNRDDPVTRLVYLPGYVSWEHALGHHDPLTDVFSLGMLLASLTCGLDFSEPADLETFVRGRRNLFDLNPHLHPVLAKVIARMTELSRHRRPQDLGAVIHTLENYRDQDIDFDFDLARIKEFKTADVRSRRSLLLGRLQQRLFELSRRNRLLHFRPTMQTVNLTWASVPLSFDVQSVRPEQILTWNAGLQHAVVSGNALSLNKYLRFEEAIYLPSVLDEIRNEAQRDQAEFGFAQLRLVLCFLRWSDLKEKPPERFDSPLVLLPVKLTKTKGVRDVHYLEPLGAEAEVNPILRHSLKQLYNIDLPESVDLSQQSLDGLHELLAAKIQASEPAVSVAKIDRPRIQLIHARARRRLDQYQRRVRLAGRGVRTFADLDYSYDRDNYHPLGLRLFQTRVRPPEVTLRTIVEETPRPRTAILPELAPAVPDKERMLYAAADEETNPYQWEFDLCSVTLGNFRYRKMSLVRDYEALLTNERPHPSFEAIFSTAARPSEAPQPGPLPLAESFAIVACDPTQASAVALARAGQDYIIQGPPGTGKSQTITNLIADYIVRGKRVLFVCEKRAAIDVVFHRLKQAGLDELCCLIHDSQADKKAFVMDSKRTYERFLETRAQPAQTAHKVRLEAIQAVSKELGPLQRFDEAMRNAPPEAGVPLHSLLQRALELAAPPELPSVEMERVPSYRHWQEHGGRITKLGTILADLRGEAVFADHPLRRLQPNLARAERPLETVSAGLDKLEQALDQLQAALQPLDLPPAASASQQALRQLLAFAAPLRFFAEHEQLELLNPKSDAARRFAQQRAEADKKAKALTQAQEATRFWRRKLPPQDAAAALQEAKSFAGSFWRFLKPGWWRLRATMKRHYDFRSHTVPPSWTQVLENLQREYECAAAAADDETELRRQYGFTGTYQEFVQQVEAARTMIRLPSPVPADLQRRLVDATTGPSLILNVLAMEPLVQQLEDRLAPILQWRPDAPLAQLRDELALIAESLDELPDFLPCLTELAALPAPLADLVRNLPLDPGQVEAAMIERTLGEVYRADRTVARFQGSTRARHLERLVEAHDRLFPANAAAVHECIRQRFLDHVALSSLPHGQLTAEQKDFKVAYNRGRRELEHEFGKTMRYKSIRDLAAGDSGQVLQDLKPVWLMSPLSVSDTLPLDANHFDVVIFDEASQVTLEEAIPAVFRAKQVIVVGDEMQLPPTNFFSSKSPDDEEASADDAQALDYDLTGNSFLNHAARRLPATMLGWHYRSRSESLISFSNAAFYHGRLLTVPEVGVAARAQSALRAASAAEAPNHVDALLARPVSFHKIDNGLYVQRRNTAEAEYIAELVRELLRRGTGLTLGIVAFSEAQQDEIEQALRQLGREDADFQATLDAEYEREQDGQFVGLLVKNLENIQGDERDVIIISVCYAPGPTGKMLMNFGPINQTGGERRLNVAFSRAKQHMVLVSSIHSPAITNDYNDGARCLKNYLRYAEAASCGDLDALTRVLRDLAWTREPERPAEAGDAVVRDVAAALRDRGCLVDFRRGQSHFRCDLAARREQDAAYRLGVLVDTAAHYAQTDVIERDVLKPQLLRSFGWTVARVLTKDWHERRGAVLKQLDRLLAGERDDAAADAAEEEPATSAVAGEPSAAAPTPSGAAEKVSVLPRSESTGQAQIAAPAPRSSGPAGISRYLEYRDGSSHKFWEIKVAGNQHTVRFGRIGADGQSKTKSFDDASGAERDALRLIREKLAKGYVEAKSGE
jgi:predicted DNA-binding WGR domain protein